MEIEINILSEKWPISMKHFLSYIDLNRINWFDIINTRALFIHLIDFLDENGMFIGIYSSDDLEEWYTDINGIMIFGAGKIGDVDRTVAVDDGIGHDGFVCRGVGERLQQDFRPENSELPSHLRHLMDELQRQDRRN